MNKKILTAPALLIAATLLTAGSFASARETSTLTSGTYDVVLNPNDASVAGTLNTNDSWQTIQIPLADIGGTLPSDLNISTLSISSAGLPQGLSISLQRVSVVGSTLLLNVDVNRSNTNAVAEGLANVTLLSGGTALTTFQVPVINVAEIGN